MMIHIDNSNNSDRMKLVRLWLLVIIALIFAMVLVGGATRLTNSGLSITEWKPILGAIPPLSDKDWLEAFNKYKQIPEFKLENPDMNLTEFKYIYWWEWSHRFLGRFIGIAFFIPMLIFWWSGILHAKLKAQLLGLFILGGLQGALGWYMVASGLAGSNRVDVSQYRLAAHLGLAILIIAATFWVYLGLQNRKFQKAQLGLFGIKLTGFLLVTLIFIQIILGALVAGIHAGKYYTTWPLMNGQFIPDNILEETPLYLNFFENPATVQFDHRILAYIIFVLVIFQLYQVISRLGQGQHARLAIALFVLVLAQVALGIWTLLSAVPLSLGLLHQGGAVILLLSAVSHLHGLYNPTENTAITDPKS